MSTNSNDQGRAYEYAWIKTLYEVLSKKRPTKIINNSSLEANKRAWNMMDNYMQNLLMLSAQSAVDTIIELEPRMVENDGDILFLEPQKDSSGISGDVRDILIARDKIQWEIGLSIKHNHEAIKHSRLSYKLDFGKEWFGVPCSKEYWNSVQPIFKDLAEEQSKGTKWSQYINKENRIYVPLLESFMEEIKRAYTKNSSIPTRMIEYLIGINDYYKVISHDEENLTIINTFNIHNTLNKPSKVKVSAISVPVVKLPTELVALRFKDRSNNTIEMYLNNGWQISFRIHNASLICEPSLKFDIQFIGMPVTILNIECKWR